MVTDVLAGRRVLVVEDEFLVLMLIEDMLADLGCRVVATAASVPKALGLVAAQPLEAAMLDMNLGGETSFPVADALAARGVPFVFATGYDGHSLPDAHRHRQVLRKPFRTQDLRHVLTQVLASPA